MCQSIHMDGRTQDSSSIAPWSSSDAHMPIVGAFGGGQGSAWAPWLLCSPIRNKLQCAVYSNTFLSEPSLTSLAIWTTIAVCWIGPHGPAFTPHVHQWTLVAHNPVRRCSVLGSLLIDTDHCRPGTPHKSCSSGDALTQSSSHHILALRLPIFPAFNTSTLRTCSLAAH